MLLEYVNFIERFKHIILLFQIPNYTGATLIILAYNKWSLRGVKFKNDLFQFK